jgi:TrmH family RNA methyltransferase
MTKIITSRTNDQVKYVVNLHQAKYRAIHKQFIAEGDRAITTLVQAGSIPLALYTCQETSPVHELAPADTLYKVTPEVMRKMSTVSSPSGLLALFTIPDQPSTLHHGIVLAQISDPGNMGTLIRSATAFGAQSVVVVEGCDPWSPKVVQASAGTITSVAIHSMAWPELVATKGSLNLCALVVKDGKNPQDVHWQQTLIVVGNEAHGLPNEWIIDSDTSVTLPMRETTESLNAAVAGSIALFLAHMYSTN